MPSHSFSFFQKGEAKQKFIGNISAFSLVCLTMIDFQLETFISQRCEEHNSRGFCSEKVLNKLAMTLDKAKRLIYILNV
jgi:hypothetical protein